MFKVGDKVLVDDQKGTIKDIHNIGFFNVYIVELNDGGITKAFKENLTKLQESEYKGNKPDTITISRKDFKKAVVKATSPNLWLGKMKDPTTVNMLTLSGLAVSLELEDILFGEAEND
jgi:hypothetical protein